MSETYPLKKVKVSKKIDASSSDDETPSITKSRDESREVKKKKEVKKKPDGKKQDKTTEKKHNGKKQDKTTEKKSKKKDFNPNDEEIDEEDIEKEKKKIEAKLQKLNSTVNGITNEEAKEREGVYGRNEIKYKKESPILQFLKSFWNPLAWIMEIAVIVSIALLDYADFALIFALLIINAIITYVESRKASGAINALMKSLAPSCICYRNGEAISTFAPADLVPGDVVLLRMGNIVPADCMLLYGNALLVDQSAITGESLPVDKRQSTKVLSGSIIKRGELKALVVRTGKDTVFGKAAKLTQSETKISRLQAILTQVSWFCITFIVIGVIIELAIEFGSKRRPCRNGDCPTLSNALVLIVGGIPVAMPTVLSITLALGAYQLARKGVIISRLSAIENLSAMDILCSDKTGTLTKNELTVIDPVSVNEDYNTTEILFLAAISVPADPSDPIDLVLHRSLSDDQKERAKQYKHVKYEPFDPIEKYTTAKIKGPKGDVFHIRKGFPHNVLKRSSNFEEVSAKVNRSINQLGKKGYRCIGVGYSDEQGEDFSFLGLIPLFDPPRDDTKEMLDITKTEGIEVKMITGDQLAIAKETSRQLGLNTNILKGEYIRDKQKLASADCMGRKDMIEEAGGFAEVYPEDKYMIVKSLHKRGHTVGMTGDGVNDTAALKKSDIGIAVAGATDAARSAADIVLLDPGLTVIIHAIIGSRKIFQRMKSYCIYSISIAVRTVIAFVVLTTAYDWYFPTIGVAILAILNDGCMISICRDRVTPSKVPDKWNPTHIFLTAILYGVYLAVSTIVLFDIVRNTNFFQDTFGLATLDDAHMVGLIYLQISVSGLSLIFITRSHGISFLDRPGLTVICAFIFAEVVASVIGAYGLNDYLGFSGAGWGYVLVGWVWSIIWYIPLDLMKAGINVAKDTLGWEEWKAMHQMSIHPFAKIKHYFRHNGPADESSDSDD